MQTTMDFGLQNSDQIRKGGGEDLCRCAEEGVSAYATFLTTIWHVSAEIPSSLITTDKDKEAFYHNLSGDKCYKKITVGISYSDQGATTQWFQIGKIQEHTATCSLVLIEQYGLLYFSYTQLYPKQQKRPCSDRPVSIQRSQGIYWAYSTHYLLCT